ncbi:glycosyltransferase family 1 protein [Microcoleus sp. FACHB-1515]|uniref:glycosyltransferase family 4 protein n=1 Tax=Cyanophyceae TaxID=3028117 RepID=UPI001684699C|nr:glycosyltransferase family 1 protein [Microcoleus sp. FACHB-1515]MBD2092304.1 glycosyltransferase family 1 protein [Microcoleus sp. FACHB-1515]
MLLTPENRVALISVSGDPAIEIGREEAGGQNVYVRQVGLALAQQGWQVDMFSRQTSPDQEAIVQHTPNCRTIRLKAGATEFISRDRVFPHLPEFVQALLDFQKQEGHQYQLVHSNYWLSSWVGMQLKKHQPLAQVHTYHSLGAIKYQAIDQIPPIAAKRLTVEKTCLETAERIVATSPQEQEHMRTYVSTKGKIDMIPCGTDTDRFGKVDRAAARAALGFSLDDKIVLYVGRFDPRKGIETLVRAIGQSCQRSNVKLVIGGGSTPGQVDGQERDRIESIVAELGLQENAIFPGQLGDPKLPLYYAAADVCVVPSHYEPFGLVAIEAMASRTPVVASDVGGLQFTVIPEVTGLLVPPKDDFAFAAAIDRILLNPDWRNQLGQTARQRVEIAFSWQSVAIRLSQLYTKLLDQTVQEQAA